MKTSILNLGEVKKHSVRYNASENDKDPVVTSIYIMKTALERPWPTQVKLTIEAVS